MLSINGPDTPTEGAGTYGPSSAFFGTGVIPESVDARHRASKTEPSRMVPIAMLHTFYAPHVVHGDSAGVLHCADTSGSV
jgi:hypothetical protein